MGVGSVFRQKITQRLGRSQSSGPESTELNLAPIDSGAAFTGQGGNP